MKVFALLSLIVCTVRAVNLAEQVEAINSKWIELNAEKDSKIELLTAQIAALSERLQNQEEPITQQRRRLAVPEDAVGLTVLNDKAFVTMGKNKDVNLYRDSSGALNVEANGINLNGNTNVNGDFNAGKLNLQAGDKKCSLSLVDGKITTDCEISSKTTRQLQDKIDNMKSCDEDAIVNKLKPHLDEILGFVKPPPVPETFKSCAEMKKWLPDASSGMYDLYPAGPDGGKINLKCEMSNQGGGWTRFLQLNGDGKSGCASFRNEGLEKETVGDYCQWKEYTFSRKMMLESKHEILFTDDQGRKMWYRFDNCNPNQCTCDMAGDDKKGLCFFLAVTADYSGGQPVFDDAAQNFNFWTEAYNWDAGNWQNAGDGHCGGTNANAHSQWNCEPANDDGKGNCGQRWHYGSRHDGSDKGGSECGDSNEGCAWAWYTGLATGWRNNCNKDNAKWMLNGPEADGAKRTAEVWFR